MSTLERFFRTWLVIVTCCGLIEVTQQAMQCGGVRNEKTRKRRKRVIGGNIARENSWPWLVNMIDKNDSLQYCSGVIIGEQWILTVAHCFIYGSDNKSVINFPFKNYKYIVADHKYNGTDRHDYIVEPAKVFFHPKLKVADEVQPGDYDIALIKLKKKLQFSKQVKQACLPTNATVFNTTTTCYLAGWGNTVNTKEYHRSPVLREVQLNLVPLEDCNRKAAYNGIVPRRFRCAGYTAGGKDGCYGDSGAPLQCYINGRWTVAGLMAWGNGCATPNRYGVYTNVQTLLSTFIKPVLKGSEDRLTTYHKRPLNRFRKNWNVQQKSFYIVFTKNEIFTDVDLVRNLQLSPMQIRLLKNITLTDYAFIMNTTVQFLMSKTKSTRLNQIIAAFKQHSTKFENYAKIKMFAKMKNQSVVEVIKKAGVPKSNLLNAGNLLNVL